MKSREGNSMGMGMEMERESDLESALAVVASEAGLVVDLVISSELIHQVHSLLTGLTLLGSPCKSCHLRSSSTPPPSNTTQFSEIRLMKFRNRDFLSLSPSAYSSDTVTESQLRRFYIELLTFRKYQLSISRVILVITRTPCLFSNYDNTPIYTGVRRIENLPRPQSKHLVHRLEQIAVFTKLIRCSTLDHQPVNDTALISRSYMFGGVVQTNIESAWISVGKKYHLSKLILVDCAVMRLSGRV